VWRFRTLISQSFVFNIISPNWVDKFSISEYHKDDSGDVLIALTRKGLSGGEVPIRDSLAN
jgi:hypothetical protein